MVKYTFNISDTAQQQRATAYFYDRCFFLSSYAFRIKQRKRRVIIVPRSVYPAVKALFSANHLSRDAVSMSSSNPGLLFYALAFEAIGFFGCQVHLYLRPLGENVSEFFIKFYKRVPSFSRFSGVLVAPALVKALHPLLDPVYTIQASLFSLKRHRVGFSIEGQRIEALYFLRWLDVVQSLYGLDNLDISFSFVHDSILCYLCQFFFDPEKHSKLKSPVNSLVLGLIGIYPQYFSYQKIVNGLSFQIVYDAKEFRIRHLL